MAMGSNNKEYEISVYNTIGQVDSDSGYKMYGPTGTEWYLSTGEPVSNYFGDLVITGTNITLKEIK